MTTRFTAKFSNGVLVPLEPVDLPNDRVLSMSVSESADTRPGVRQLLHYIETRPPLPAGLGEEFSAALASHDLPADVRDPLD
jgi:hypothetical protein